MTFNIDMSLLSDVWIHRMWAKLPKLDESEAPGIRHELIQRQKIRVAIYEAQRMQAKIEQWDIR
jgi:hypothetical protein